MARRERPTPARAPLPRHAGEGGVTMKTFRAGFSFAEVMFAVVVLGIGFIMLASIFPVAIRQTASVVEENDATALTKKAAEQFREALIASGALPSLPSTAEPIELPAPD